MAESEVRDPRQRALSAIVAANVVRGARRVHHADEVELAAIERPGCLVRGSAGDLDAGDVARVGARVGLVAHEDEPRVAVLELPERSADDLSLRIRPVVAGALDRVLRKGAGIRTVDDAHEVRGRRDEPELDWPCRRAPARRSPRHRRCGRENTPRRSRARSRSARRFRAARGRASAGCRTPSHVRSRAPHRTSAARPAGGRRSGDRRPRSPSARRATGRSSGPAMPRPVGRRAACTG